MKNKFVIKGKIKKNEICKLVSEKTNISQNKINIIYDEIFEQIKIELQKGKTLTVKNFAKFELITCINFKNKIPDSNGFTLKIKKSKMGWNNEKSKIQTNSD